MRRVNRIESALSTTIDEISVSAETDVTGGPLIAITDPDNTARIYRFHQTTMNPHPVALYAIGGSSIWSTNILPSTVNAGYSDNVTKIFGFHIGSTVRFWTLNSGSNEVCWFELNKTTGAVLNTRDVTLLDSIPTVGTTYYSGITGWVDGSNFRALFGNTPAGAEIFTFIEATGAYVSKAVTTSGGWGNSGHLAYYSNSQMIVQTKSSNERIDTYNYTSDTMTFFYQNSESGGGTGLFVAHYDASKVAVVQKINGTGFRVSILDASTAAVVAQDVISRSAVNSISSICVQDGDVIVIWNDGSVDYETVVTYTPGGSSQSYDQTEFELKPANPNAAAVSFGTPDAGVNVPATDALVEGIVGGKTDFRPYRYVEQVRLAVETLASTNASLGIPLLNPATSNAYTWDDADADNLYNVALGQGNFASDLGISTVGYRWARPHIATKEHEVFDVDVGELDVITKELERAAIAQGLLAA